MALGCRFIKPSLVRPQRTGREISFLPAEALGLGISKRGQFMIIASLLIGVLVLGLAIGVNEMGLQRQELRYKPLKELVFSITNDAQRALTTALKKGTESYEEYFWKDDFPQNHYDAEVKAFEVIENFMSVWARSALASFSSEGIQLKIPFRDPQLFEKEIKWIGNTGFSNVKMRAFSFNLTAEGFSGWEGSLASYYSLYAPISVSERENATTIKIWLCKWTGKMGEFQTFFINNLIKEDIWIRQYQVGAWEDIEVEDLRYLGEGWYNLTLMKEIVYGTKLKILIVVPEDQVRVGVYAEVGPGKAWNQLFFQSPYHLSPEYNPNHSLHLIQPYSQGKGKSDVILRTEITAPFSITLEDYAIIKMSLRRNPPKAEVDYVDVNFGYTKDDIKTLIKFQRYEAKEYGGTENLISEFKNGMCLNLTDVGERIIPKGSIIWLNITVKLSSKPYGTTMIECGFRFDSQIQLGIPPEIRNVTCNYKSIEKTFSVEANITDADYGGSSIAFARCRLGNETYQTDWCNMTAVKGQFDIDSEVRVNGTITLPNGFISGDYILWIEAYDAVGGRRTEQFLIKGLNVTESNPQTWTFP